MKLLHKDRQTGELRIQVDTLDDLWTLRNLIRPGDLVSADTYRTVDTGTDKIRSEKAAKKRMRLGVRVEQVEWHDFADHLRVLGTIEEGPQDIGRHHTHVFRDDYGTELTLRKRDGIQAWDLRAIKEAEEATKRPRVVLLALDDQEAQFATLTSYGVQLLGSIMGAGQGKRFDGAAGAKRQYYDEVLRTLKTLRPDPTTPFMVVGPGWWREEFLDVVKQKAPEQAKGAMTDGTAQAGRNGIHEALRRGMLESVARDHRVAEDTALIESLLARIAKGDRTVTYGKDDVADAVRMGAVEVVLVTDELVRHGKMDDLLLTAEQASSRIHIIATGHEGGAQFQRMGGIAALLRFAYP